MNFPEFFRSQALGLAALFAVLVCQTKGQQGDPAKIARLQGGLVVQLGARDTNAAAELSLTGRYLIHVLDTDAERVRQAQSRLRKEGLYGMVWAEFYPNSKHLPYAENTVNLIVIRDYTVGVEELMRVLTPGGSLVVTHAELLPSEKLKAAGFETISQADSNLITRKPWPKAMDVWSHPRHAADGNAVSLDSLVGPPDRVRWIAAATSEVEGMVTAGGRNFYGGILARDSFNGLRLWHRSLNGKNDDIFEAFELPKLSTAGARPTASDRLLFAVLKNRPVALDAKTGEVVIEFDNMVNPANVLHDGTRVIATDGEIVRAATLQEQLARLVCQVCQPHLSDNSL